MDGTKAGTGEKELELYCAHVSCILCATNSTCQSRYLAHADRYSKPILTKAEPYVATRSMAG